MKTIKEIDVKEKNVILRCDFNVPIKDGKILSDERIISSLETIKYLISKNAKVVIMSHLGKIKSIEDTKNNSLRPIYEHLKGLLPEANGIYFSSATSGIDLEESVGKLQAKEILVMENTRFEDLNNKKESNNDLELARYWASLGDVFIDDAFGMTHRKHASNCGIKKYLPSAIGFLVEKELEMLELLINPKAPFTVIMGGAKVGDKSLLIRNILKRCDYLLLGGGIANTFLGANHEIGESLASKEFFEEAKELLLMYPNKIILPLDLVVENNGVVHTKKITKIAKDDIIYDIGPKTIELYKKYIEIAETVFINGTAGYYEDERFTNGTESMLEICSKVKGKVILGGGDALTSANHFNINNFYHKSTGGGATLEYISSSKLLSMEETNILNIEKDFTKLSKNKNTYKNNGVKHIKEG